MRFAAALRYDIKFQIRHGFYTAYGLITLFYVGALLNLPAGIRPITAVACIFSDTSVLGFFFIGGILMLERRQGTLHSLFVTPIRLTEYLWAKTLSLTLLATVVSVILLLISGNPASKNLWIIPGIILSAVLFILFGIAVAVRSHTLNGYFYLGIAYSIVFMLPLLEFFHILPFPLLRLLPTWGILRLVQSTYSALSFPEMASALGLLIVWCGLGYWWAVRWFHRYVILQTGAAQ